MQSTVVATNARRQMTIRARRLGQVLDKAQPILVRDRSQRRGSDDEDDDQFGGADVGHWKGVVLVRTLVMEGG
jgi:hypothetical protein